MDNKRFEDFIEYLYSTENVVEWDKKEQEIREVILACRSQTSWGDVSRYIEKRCEEWTKFALYKYHLWSGR